MEYNFLANKYDSLIYDVDYDLIRDFYEEILNNLNIEVRDVLELGCGTGNVTERLIGYNIFAIDNSEEMLSVARSKFFGRRNVSFFNMDIRNFHFNKKFDMCVASLDVINYIHYDEEVKKVFSLVSQHLKEDGIFIFDINSEYKIKDFIGNNIFTDEVDDVVYIWQGSYDNETNINEFLLTFFVKDKDNKYDRYSESHMERAYSKEIIEKYLLESGFNQVHCFDEFSTNKVKEDSLRISFVGIKKGE